MNRANGAARGGAHSATRPGRRRAAKGLACAVIFSVSAVMLGLTVKHGLQGVATQDSQVAISQARRGDRLEECTYRAIRAQLPRGASVYVAGYWLGNEARLTDLETLWTVPQVDQAKAQWILAVGRGPVCSSQMLKIRRR